MTKRSVELNEGKSKASSSHLLIQLPSAVWQQEGFPDPKEDTVVHTVKSTWAASDALGH